MSVLTTVGAENVVMLVTVLTNLNQFVLTVLVSNVMI
jgi:hypothetical protein